jgi:hypothetical protein
VLALIFIVLVLTKIKAYADEDEYSPLKYIYTIFTNAPRYFHFMAVFVPLVNMVFAGLALLVIFKLIRHWFVMRRIRLGSWISHKFIKNPHKHFKTKDYILRHFFRPYLQVFHEALLLDETTWNNVLSLLKKVANEKTECKSECDPKPYTASSDQETPAQRQENNGS